MVFVAEIYLCRDPNDPACVQESCDRRKRQAAEPDQITRLEAKVRVVDVIKPSPSQ